MAKRPARLARLSPLLAGGLLAAALAVPAGAVAQAPLPGDNGLIGVTDGNGTFFTTWSDGTHKTDIDSAPTGMVGTWSADNRLPFLPGMEDFAVIDADVSYSATTLYSDPEAEPVGGAVGDPRSGALAISGLGGVSVIDGSNPPTKVSTLGAGRIGWSTEGSGGALVFDAIAADEAEIPGGDLPFETPANEVQEGGVVRIDLDDPNHIAVPLTDDQTAMDPSVSQDGNVIAWQTAAESQTDIKWIDRREVGTPVHTMRNTSPLNEWLPTVSPDGESIAYAVQAGPESTPWLAVQTLRGSEAPQLLHEVTTEFTGIAWQPTVKADAGAPSVQGAAEVGQQLSIGGTAAKGGAPLTKSHTWKRCLDALPDNDDDGCSTVGTGTTYTVQAADEGYRIKVVTAAANPAGTDTSDSPLTAVVTDPNAQSVDSTPPAQPTLDAAPPKKTNKTNASFDFSGAEAGGRFECAVVAGWGSSEEPAWQDCSSPATYPSLTEGKKTFHVRQVDDFDNNGAAATYEWEIDTTPPVAPTFTAKPANPTTSTSATFEWTGSGEQGAGIQCRVDPVPTESEGVSAQLEPSIHEWHPCGSPQTFDLLPGKHRFEVRERDAAGNPGAVAWYEWDITSAPPVVVDPPVVTPPVVTPPVVEKPVEKPAEKPVETPAPVVQTPAVETPKAQAPKAEEPKKETPKPVVTPVKPPALTATIGGTKSGAQVGAKGGGTSSAATIEVAKEAVGVGCSITGTVLKACKVDLYAPKASGATARAAAAAEVLVGTGTYTKAAGSSKMDVKVELNATGKAMLRKNPDGLKVTVKITGTPVSGPALKATGVAKLLTDRARATVGGFAVDSPVLTAAAKRQLRTLARFGKADTVRCVGHTDGSSDDESYLKGLGLERAKAVCAYLVANGAKGARVIVSKGKALPAATNATAAGRAKNRRVQVTLVR